MKGVLVLNKKICHLTSAHSRLDVRILLKECVSLANNGFETILIVADGLGDESYNGVKIKDAGKAQGRLSRIKASVFVYKLAKREKNAIFHIHDPDLLWAVVKLKRISPIVYDVHEDVAAAILQRNWLNALLRKIISFLFAKLEKLIASKCVAILCATESIANKFKKNNKEIHVINNYPFKKELIVASNRKEANKICYTGVISKARGIHLILDTLEYTEDISLVLAGKFENKSYEQELRSHNAWMKVEYKGFVDRKELALILSECYAGIVPFLPFPNHIHAQPNKLFEYMSAGLAIIASDFKLWKEIVESGLAGICINPSKQEEFLNAINYLFKNPVVAKQMGRNGMELVSMKYNWGNEEKKLIKFYEGIIKDHE